MDRTVDRRIYKLRLMHVFQVLFHASLLVQFRSVIQDDSTDLCCLEHILAEVVNDVCFAAERQCILFGNEQRRRIKRKTAERVVDVFLEKFK